MRRATLSFFSLALIFGLLFYAAPVWAATSYTVDSIPVVGESTDASNLKSLAKLTIMGYSTSTFTGGDADRVEFRLPSDFYFRDCGVVNSAEEAEDYGIAVQVVAGFDAPLDEAVQIEPKAEIKAGSGKYNGFEIKVNKPSGGDGDNPELIIYFKNIFIPPGATGNVSLLIEPRENSGFSERSSSLTIATVAEARLTLNVEKTVTLTTTKENQIGPILITENLAGAFEYLELSLPAGFSWVEDTAVFDPLNGLGSDSGGGNRDFAAEVDRDNKYGVSKLRVSLLGDPSQSRGSLRLSVNINVDDEVSSFGSVTVDVESEAEPSTNTLHIGSFAEQKVTVSAGSVAQLYGGFLNQEIPNITISENAPDTLMAQGRQIKLQLPNWAKWTAVPWVKVEGSTELELGLDDGNRAFLRGDDQRTVYFTVDEPSDTNAARIIIKEGKVSLPVDASGDLTVNVYDTEGEINEVKVGSVQLPVTVKTEQPSLVLGKLNQAAGNLEIAEAAGQTLLARDLWIDFPYGIVLSSTPEVKVTAGNLKLDTYYRKSVNGVERLIIPIETSSSAASTISVTGILYDISNILPDGKLEVKVGGPAVNEVNFGASEDMFPNSDWAAIVANGIIGSAAANPTIPGPNPTVPTVPTTPTPNPTGIKTVVFTIGNPTYRVNGLSRSMDVAPYIENSRTFLPIRYVALALGLTEDDIIWDDTTKTATLLKKDLIVQFKVGETAIYRSGIRIPADAAAAIRQDRLMVPLRAVSQAFGARVEWEEASKSVTIFP